MSTATPETTDKPWANLSVEDTEAPVRQGGGRPSKYSGPNPFLETLTDSYEKFSAGEQCGKAFSCTGQEAYDAAALIRRAADELTIGVSIVIMHNKDRLTPVEARDQHGKRKVRVVFSAKNRRQKRVETSEDAPEATEE